jgi:hypothetical protein
MWKKFGISSRSSSKTRRAETFFVLLPYLGSSRRFTETETDLRLYQNPKLLELFGHHLRHHQRLLFPNCPLSMSTLLSLNMHPSPRIPLGWFLDPGHSAIECLSVREALWILGFTYFCLNSLFSDYHSVFLSIS